MGGRRREARRRRRDRRRGEAVQSEPTGLSPAVGETELVRAETRERAPGHGPIGSRFRDGNV